MYYTYPYYLNCQAFSSSELLHPAIHGPSKSYRSSKTGSRKGSTDIDSKIKFKTEECKYWKNGMECPFLENCNFAHGEQDKRLRQTLPSKYKTKCCYKFNQEGYCPYGSRCQFIHCTHKCLRVQHCDALECLGNQSDKFFSFLEERQKNSGKCQRLNIFAELSEKNNNQVCKLDQIIENQDQYQNHVDIRSRHNSF